LWLASKVLIKTSVQEGLNMNPLEFVLVKEPPNKGVVVLSEFTTSCAVLNGAMRINPWDVKNVAETLYQALQAGEAECYKRRARDLEYICMRPSSEWTKRILLDAERTRRLEDTTDMEEIRPGQYRVSRRGALKLEASVLLHTMASSRDEGRPCVFLFDYGGTLIERENSNMHFKREFFGVTRRAPTEMTKRWIRALCLNPMNAVFVVSGASAKVLNKNFGEIAGLGLAAENGMYFSWDSGEARKTRSGIKFSEETDDDNQANQPFAPQMVRRKFPQNVGEYKNLNGKGEGISGRQWIALANSHDLSEWKGIAIPILQNYTGRCAGSRLRVSDHHLSWDFRLADPEWAKINAKHLQSELLEALSECDVNVEVWKGSVNVIPSNITKGLVVEHVLGEVQSIYGRRAGMVFCVGDDLADESMFEASLEYESEKLPRNRADLKQVFTCCVGKKPSVAEYYVNTVKEVQNLLRDLTQENWD
jgi:trehalose 6-phosphate synthase/phosphatase